MSYRLRQFAAVALALAVVAVPVAAVGAEQGQISAANGTSTGTLDLSLVVPRLVQISGLNDIDLGEFDGGALDGQDDVCVWSTTRVYQITARGDGDDDAFILSGPGAGANAALLDYSVDWLASGGTREELSSGATLAAQTTSASSPDCDGGSNATVFVGVGSDELGAAPSGIYTGTLTLVVAPE